MTQQVLNGAATPVEEDIPDFGRKRRRNVFKIDGEMFEAASGLPVEQAMEFYTLSEQWSSADPDEAKALLRELFSKVLLPESLERFVARLSDLENPIEVHALSPIIGWLFERYGLRPTAEPSGSSTGSANPDDGTNSPADSPSTALISTAFPSTAP